MARPVVATENALQGIPGAEQAGISVASDPSRMAGALCTALTGATDAPNAREFVRRHYGWSSHLEPVVRLFDRVVSGATPVRTSRTAMA